MAIEQVPVGSPLPANTAVLVLERRADGGGIFVRERIVTGKFEYLRQEAVHLPPDELRLFGLAMVRLADELQGAKPQGGAVPVPQPTFQG